MDKIDRAAVRAGENGGPDTILVVKTPSPSAATVLAVKELAVSQPRANRWTFLILGVGFGALAFIAWQRGIQLDRIELTLTNFLETK